MQTQFHQPVLLCSTNESAYSVKRRNRSNESKRQIEGVADREESDKSGRWTEGKMADRGGSQGGRSRSGQLIGTAAGAVDRGEDGGSGWQPGPPVGAVFRNEQETGRGKEKAHSSDDDIKNLLNTNILYLDIFFHAQKLVF